MLSEERFCPDHIQNRDVLGNDHHKPDARCGGFASRVRRRCRRDKDHADVGAGCADGLFHRIEYGHAKNSLPAPAGRYTADDMGTVLNHLFRMEMPFPSGNALYQHLALRADQDAHAHTSRCVSAVRWAIRRAASGMDEAVGN